MQINTSSLQSQPRIVYAIFLLVTLTPLYYVSYQYHLRHPYGSSSPLDRPAHPASPQFIRDWLDTHVVSPFNPYALEWYCNQSDWRPGLVFNLANANGGIGNIRGNMLDFLFQSIEAGASILLPGMASRSDEDLSNVWASRSPFDHFFDEEWFLKTVQKACPEMSVYKPQPDQPLKEAVPGVFYPRSRRADTDFGNSKRAYLEGLQTFLDEHGQVEPDNVTLVDLERTLWEIDTRSLPLNFRRDFGQLLRINPTIRRLAAVVVQQLSLKFGVDIDPRIAIPRGAFYGAHLRTESDAQNAGWLDETNANFSAQTDSYIAQALNHKLKVIYVASGNATDLALFRRKALSHAPPLNVTSKFDLLPPNEAAALKDMTWDQQALVDYEVLQRCSIFGGLAKSSFSYNIAMTRNQWLEDQGRVNDPWMVQHSEDGVSFDDGISRVLARDGVHEQRIPRGMWP
ncbi:hypothetical protein M409DRAFT_25456 [Zasmidium cellare ATCC 36951]|uniref:Alternative oxidase n=1 Tax=Zasmidium cellare ATCC 36951 TaxID=1080233 RepID=A0A6A6CEM2_ZASCE|nr:uncharacterized protein M409DRAFT_25456 [Zasmidium cellare ATCC 36951]KAF2164109.1 hypothetical protein M409DRAFT_25456 [Zasmidium cellare ATCC 36951]